MVYGTLNVGVDYITSPYAHSRVDSNTFTMGNPMPESTFSPSQGLWISPLKLVLFSACSFYIFLVFLNSFSILSILFLPLPLRLSSVSGS